MDVCERGETEFKLLYPAEASLEEKITTISKEIYGADGIELSELARKQLETYTAQGYAHLPSKKLPRVSCLMFHGLTRPLLFFYEVCMAKTQYSFSHDPKLKGVPKGGPFISHCAFGVDRY